MLSKTHRICPYITRITRCTPKTPIFITATLLLITFLVYLTPPNILAQAGSCSCDSYQCVDTCNSGFQSSCTYDSEPTSPTYGMCLHCRCVADGNPTATGCRQQTSAAYGYTYECIIEGTTYYCVHSDACQQSIQANLVTIPTYNFCAHTDDPGCGDCVGNGGIWTAIGCIDPEPQNFVPNLINMGLGMAGGLALLIMLFGVFQIVTAGGDPEKVASGKETFTNAAIGLLFIVFSLVLLHLTGSEILDLPGF